MSNKAIVFEAAREGYGIDQILDGRFGQCMTVGELRDILADIPDDTYFVLSHDNGFTFGSIHVGDYCYMKEFNGDYGEPEWDQIEECDFFYED